jgi:hypothetical protein
MLGWQVYTYRWSYCTANGPEPIPDHLLFGGRIFKTRKLAEEAWYDTCPGRNDKACYIRTPKEKLR